MKTNVFGASATTADQLSESKNFVFHSTSAIITDAAMLGPPTIADELRLNENQALALVNSSLIFLSLISTALKSTDISFFRSCYE